MLVIKLVYVLLAYVLLFMSCVFINVKCFVLYYIVIINVKKNNKKKKVIQDLCLYMYEWLYTYIEIHTERQSIDEMQTILCMNLSELLQYRKNKNVYHTHAQGVY